MIVIRHVTRTRFLPLVLAAYLVAHGAAGTHGPLQPQRPAEGTAGFSPEGLARLDAFARRLVDEGRVAGAVVLLERGGTPMHFEAYGWHDLEARRPLERDALFRICSMSKIVTSVAALMLFEEGHFLLDDPVAHYLSEFADPRVLADPSAPAGGEPVLVAAQRPITVRHLLTHTSGIAYGFLAPPTLGELYARAGISDGLAQTAHDLAENVRRIAAQPLLHQPGEGFSYGLSTDVLGRLVEVVSGQDLGSFLWERLFLPLGMRDTGFTVDGAGKQRLAKVYRRDRGETLQVLEERVHVEGPLVFSPSYPYDGSHRNRSGGAGLVTSAADFARFCRMLASGGRLDGVRVLGRKTVELLASDHIGALEASQGRAFGLGLGLAADPGRSGAIATQGTWSWDGFYTTRFWIDPREDLVGVILTQTFPYNSERVLDRLQAAAYQALE